MKNSILMKTCQITNMSFCAKNLDFDSNSSKNFYVAKVNQLWWMKKSSLAGMHILQKRHQELLSFPELLTWTDTRSNGDIINGNIAQTIFAHNAFKHNLKNYQSQFCKNISCFFLVTLNGFAEATGA